MPVTGGKSAYWPWVSHLKQEKDSLSIYALFKLYLLSILFTLPTKFP